jgi:hypothetical protein
MDCRTTPTASRAIGVAIHLRPEEGPGTPS